jgi:hypothetical protein
MVKNNKRMENFLQNFRNKMIKKVKKRPIKNKVVVNIYIKMEYKK